jgi:hypothetical protein
MLRLLKVKLTWNTSYGRGSLELQGLRSGGFIDRFRNNTNQVLYPNAAYRAWNGDTLTRAKWHAFGHNANGVEQFKKRGRRRPRQQRDSSLADR